MLFSADRSRRLSIVAIVQDLIRLDKNYGREGAQVIWNNCQLTIFGGFAPGSGQGQGGLQLMEQRSMIPDELKSMHKGGFITMKTGMHPMKTKFGLFLKWGIRFGKQFELPEHSARKIQYAGGRSWWWLSPIDSRRQSPNRKLRRLWN